MEKYTEESIKKQMEGIHETDLQNRLKNLYTEKRKIDSKKIESHKNDEKTAEKLKILEENINLSIKVYERELPQRIVERAKRSAGIYEIAKEFSASVKREEKSLNEDKDELEK